MKHKTRWVVILTMAILGIVADKQLIHAAVLEALSVLTETAVKQQSPSGN